MYEPEKYYAHHPRLGGMLPLQMGMEEAVTRVTELEQWLREPILLLVTDPGVDEHVAEARFVVEVWGSGEQVGPSHARLDEAEAGCLRFLDEADDAWAIVRLKRIPVRLAGED